MIVHNTTKFKTTIVTVRFKEEIKEDNIGYRALLSGVMSTVTPTYRTRKALNQALKSLYGASISARTTKVGKLSIIEFSLTMIDPSFMDEGFFERGLKILHEVIYGHKNLPKREFELEKRLTLEKIVSANNNKTSFALIKLFEHMFKNERYSLRVSGTKEIIKKVTYEDLNKYYKKLIKENDVDVSISGNVDDTTKELVLKYFKEKNEYKYHPVDEESHINNGVNEIIDYDDINQAKLNIGYSFDVNYNDEDYISAVLFNTAFGGAVHSRLFLNVREKHSLCYYISSSFDAYKGFIYVYTGVDKANLSFAKDLINQELLDLQTNLLSIEELELTKKSLINQLKETQDSQSSISSVLYQQFLINVSNPLEKSIERVKSVTPEQILNVAKKVNLDTIYILSPEEVL